MKNSVPTQPTTASRASRSGNGRRTVPVNHWFTEELAAEGPARDVGRDRAAAAVKTIAAAIGLKPPTTYLLDVLLSFSAHQDWAAGRQAIVWPSNAVLMDQTGMSLSALRRHIKVLENTGLIFCRDSGNGKRCGDRDANGEITTAYGFDLSPLKARVEEFEALGQQIKQEREACRFLRSDITSARRTARALIQDASGGVIEGIWVELDAALDELIAPKPSRKPTSEELRSRLGGFQSLLHRIKEAVAKQERSHRLVRSNANHKTTPIAS